MRLEELRHQKLNLNAPLRCDLATRIENAKNGEISVNSPFKETPNRSYVVMPRGEVVRDNFGDQNKYMRLNDFIQVGWWAIVPHGRRERCCEIISVGLRRVTVKLPIVQASGETSFATLRAHQISGVIKHETHQGTSPS